MTKSGKKCECGCGKIVNEGSRFKQGHDAKLRSKLLNRNDASARKQLAAHGWPVPRK